MNNISKSICLVGGHSAGHIIPLLTIAEQLHTMHPEIIITACVGTKPLDYSLVKDISWLTTTTHIPLTTPPRTIFSLSWGSWIFNVWISMWRTIYHLHRTHPTEIITTGSVVALPVCLYAWILRIPITLWELNSEPGRTTNLVSQFAQHINICHPETRAQLPLKTQARCKITEYPVRFTSKTPPITAPEARKIYQLNPEIRTIFIMGGSQGSHALSNLITSWLDTHPELWKKIQVIHQTGYQDTAHWKSWYTTRAIPAHVFQYDSAMHLLYSAADTIIARAGAGTLAEIIWAQKQALIIPLITPQTNHQRANAHAYARKYPEYITVLEQEKMVKNISIVDAYFTIISGAPQAHALSAKSDQCADAPEPYTTSGHA